MYQLKSCVRPYADLPCTPALRWHRQITISSKRVGAAHFVQLSCVVQYSAIIFDRVHTVQPNRVNLRGVLDYMIIYLQ